MSQSALCKIEDGTAHNYVNLPEPDQADMAFFMEQLYIILPVLDFDYLRLAVAEDNEKGQLPASESHLCLFFLVNQRY